MAEGEKHAGGRPTDYIEEVHIPLVATTIPDGATLPQIAVACGQHVGTIKLWMKEHAEFMTAVLRARDEADSPVVSTVYHLSQRSSSEDRDRLRAAELWLKCRRPDEWRDRVEMTGAEGGPIAVTNLSDEELLTEAAAIIAARGASAGGSQTP